MQLGRPQRRRFKLSLIPLIDVMLVLLFFFMLATSYVDVGRTKLDLAPDGRAGAGGDELSAQVTVFDDGQLRYAGSTRPLADWLAELKALPPSTELRLAPAPGVSLQGLIAAWEQLQAAGVRAQLAGGTP